MAHNAKAGGEIGANGEYYKGGQFVADNPNTSKKHGSFKNSHKIEIEPYTWVEADSSHVALMSIAKVGVLSKFKRANGFRDYSELVLVEDYQKIAKFLKLDIEETKKAIEAYNNGERIKIK